MTGSQSRGVYAERAEIALAGARSKGGSAVLLSQPDAIRWCCGFTGSNGLLLIDQDGCTLFTDGRYTSQAGEEVEGAEIVIVAGNLIAAAAAHKPDSLVVQGDHLSALSLNELTGYLSGAKILAESSFLDPERAEKTPSEIDAIHRALQISERVIAGISDVVEEGVTERRLAAEIDYRQRMEGADRTAFETIVAFGERSALPHARPGSRRLNKNEPILIDTGCVVDGYASDITRNLFFGKPGEQYLEVFAVVEQAVQSAIKSARSGIEAGELDGASRGVIENAGYGKQFSHSLGHGVGLCVHEWPRIASGKTDRLPEQAVVTLEPGIYLPGEFGIRLEDLVVLEPGGCRRLNGMSRSLITVSMP